MDDDMRYLLIILCLIACTIIHCNTVDDYERNIFNVKTNIYEQMELSFEVCALYSEVWKNAIQGGWYDFNSEIAAQHSRLDANGINDSLRNIKSQIERNIQKLSDPPSKYEHAYKKLVELYGIYSQLQSLALAPSGSLLSFNITVQNLQNDFIKTKNEFEVLLPPK